MAECTPLQLKNIGKRRCGILLGVLMFVGGVYGVYLGTETVRTEWGMQRDATNRVYVFSEYAPPDEYWDYELRLPEGRNISVQTGSLSVNGFQTELHLRTTQKVKKDGSIDVFFFAYMGSNATQAFVKGVRLFSLVPATQGYQIRWDAMQPKLASDNYQFEEVSP